jgi:sugar lactone lactonase YvrE
MFTRNTFAVGALALGVLLLASPAEAATPQQLLSLDPSLGQLPESLTVDARGNFYVSMGSQVAKIDRSFAVSTLATLPIAAGGFATGLKFAPSGRLFIASGAFDPTLDASYVFSLDTRTGDLSVVTSLDPDGFPNDMAFDDAGATFLTDSFLGVVWKISPGGAASIWASDPLLQGNGNNPVLGLPFGANGIVFDRAKRKLYIANTDLGAILTVRVQADGSAGDVEVFAADAELTGADGLAFDRAGTLYVAVNAQDQLATVDKRGRVRVIAEGPPLDGPSSLAFGVAHCDRHSLFISNFAISRATGAIPGPPNPGLLSLRVGTPGLSLP